MEWMAGQRRAAEERAVNESGGRKEPAFAMPFVSLVPQAAARVLRSPPSQRRSTGGSGREATIG